MLFCCMQETGAGNESSFFSLASAQTVDAEAGDIACQHKWKSSTGATGTRE